MKQPQSYEDIRELMHGYVTSAALNLALEKGLFWDIEDTPKSVESISELYSIPLDRCEKWLALLVKLGIVGFTNSLYSNTNYTRAYIVEKYSRETWNLLAQEAREQYHAIIDLNEHISHPKSVWKAQGIENIGYIEKMQLSRERAERFTRMLYELHKPLGEQISNLIDTKNVEEILDIGGGSGVISFAFLKDNPSVRSTVLDIENVCIAGRKIAEENGLAERIKYRSSNFVDEELPEGYGLVLECDVGIYNHELFSKIFGSLNEGGLFAIVSNTNEQGAWLHEPDELPSLRSHQYGFISSLSTDKIKELNSDDLRTILSDVGFTKIKVDHLKNGMILIRASKNSIN